MFVVIHDELIQDETEGRTSAMVFTLYCIALAYDAVVQHTHPLCANTFFVSPLFSGISRTDFPLVSVSIDRSSYFVVQRTD